MGNFLDKIKNSFNEVWGGLEKKHRIQIVVVGILTIALIASVVFLTSRTKFEPLYESLSQATAGQVNATLKEMGIKTKVEGTKIYVPEGKASELRIQLAADGVVTDEGEIPEPSTSSFYETSEDKRQRYLKEKQRDLEKGLRVLKGVEYARVDLYIPDDSSIVLDGSKIESTAGIIIKMKTGAEPLNNEQVKGIKGYLVKSVKGLKLENIEMIDENGFALGEQQQGTNGIAGTNLNITDTVKKNIEGSITKFLQKVFGSKNVEVLAAVKLDFDSEEVQSIEYTAPDTDKNAGIIRNMEEMKREWVDAGDGGVAGTDSNSDITEYVEADSSKAQYSEASNVVNYEINEIKKQIVKEQGNIEGLTISVLINKGSLKEDVLADVDALQADVKELVKYATQGFNTQALTLDDSISIKVMDFDTSLAKDIEDKMKEEAIQKRNESLIMIGAAIAAILVLGGAMFVLLKKRKDTDDNMMFQDRPNMAQANQNTVPIQEIELENNNELKKNLEKFVGQKPEQVAQLLKNWLNED